MPTIHVHSPGSPDYLEDEEGNRLPVIEVPGLGMFFNNVTVELTDDQVATFNAVNRGQFPEDGVLHVPPLPVDPESEEPQVDEVGSDDEQVNPFFEGTGN